MSAAEVFNVDYHIEMTDTPSGPCAEVTAIINNFIYIKSTINV